MDTCDSIGVVNENIRVKQVWHSLGVGMIGCLIALSPDIGNQWIKFS